MSNKPSFFRRKIMPYLAAVWVDLNKLWWAIREKALCAYYERKLGVPVKEFPPDVIRKIWFPNGVDKETVNAICFTSDLDALAKAYQFSPFDTRIGNCYAAIVQGRYQEVELIDEFAPIYDLDTHEVRQYVYDKLVADGDLRAKAMEIANPELHAQVQRWLKNKDRSRTIKES